MSNPDRDSFLGIVAGTLISLVLLWITWNMPEVVEWVIKITGWEGM
jgi:hypothetical protein